MSTSSPPIGDFRSELGQTLQWLESLGIDYRPTRFGKYARDILQNTGKTLDADSYDAPIEAHDLIVIHRGLASFTADVFLSKLKEFIAGPVHAKSERSDGTSHRARSIGLELLIASHFALGGFSVRFSPRADFEFTYNGVLFFVECKRPQSYGTVKTNLENAYKQLRRNYSASKDLEHTRGLVVMSIAKFSNPENRTLGLSTWDEYAKLREKLVLNFLERNRLLWNTSVHPNTMGVLGYIQIAAKIAERPGGFIYREFGGICVRPGHQANVRHLDPDRQHFGYMVHRLKQGYREAFAS